MASSSSPKQSLQKIFLTDLPSGVIDTILGHLPIRDAVNTSLLSRTWRHRWRSIPDLHVDSGRGDAAFVDRVLLLHNGPIRSFFLSFHDRSSWAGHVARWLSALSVNPLPFRSIILHIGGVPIRLNTTIFSFHNLTHLELHQCILPDHLISFQGFPSLQTLVLDYWSAPFASDIISGCPLLQNLILTGVGGAEGLYPPIFRFRAQNLRSLVFHGALLEFHLVSAPLLTTVTIDLEEIITQVLSDDDSDDDYIEAIYKADSYYQGDCNLIKVFGHAQNVEKLELLCLSLRFLGERRLPEITFSFDRLKILTMTVEFQYVNESLSTALYLLTCSPNLEELEVKGLNHKYIQEKTKIPSREFWQKHDRLELSKLRTMKFTNIILAGLEIEFMSFILSKAQGLDKMVIDVSPEDDEIVINKSQSENFTKFLRDFTQAEITLIGDQEVEEEDDEEIKQEGARNEGEGQGICKLELFLFCFVILFCFVMGVCVF